jgi:translation initiation factor 2A
VYEIYTSTKESKDNPNLYIYEACSGKELLSFTCKKHSEFEPCISSDEKVIAIKLSDYIHFYELNAEGAFERAQHRLQGKVISFSMSPGNAANVTAFYGSDKGSPSMVRMFRYPNFDTPIATKSFSQADKVEMIWNKRGTGCLIMTTTEVDNSGQSYYGKQALHFLASNGDSYSVPFSKTIIFKSSI